MTDNVFFRPSLQRSPVESQQGWRHALVLGVAALVLTGCGGGSDSESTPPAPTPSAPAASLTAIGCLLRRWGRAVGRRQYLGSAIHETNLDQHRHPRRDRRGV